MVHSQLEKKIGDKAGSETAGTEATDASVNRNLSRKEEKAPARGDEVVTGTGESFTMHATTASEVDAPGKADRPASGAPVDLGPVQAGGGVHSDAAAPNTAATPANATSTSGEAASRGAARAEQNTTSSSSATDVSTAPSTDNYVPTAPTPANPTVENKNSAAGLLSRFTENFKGDK